MRKPSQVSTDRSGMVTSHPLLPDFPILEGLSKNLQALELALAKVISEQLAIFGLLVRIFVGHRKQALGHPAVEILT